MAATDGAAEAWRNLAICLELAKRPTDAEPAYLKALAAEPTDATSRVNLGMLLARAGRVGEAESHLARVMPTAAVHHHLAHAAQQRGDARQAARHLRAAAAADPSYSNVRVRAPKMEPPRQDAATASAAALLE